MRSLLPSLFVIIFIIGMAYAAGFIAKSFIHYINPPPVVWNAPKEYPPEPPSSVTPEDVPVIHTPSSAESGKWY